MNKLIMVTAIVLCPFMYIESSYHKNTDVSKKEWRKKRQEFNEVVIAGKHCVSEKQNIHAGYVAASIAEKTGRSLEKVYNQTLQNICKKRRHIARQRRRDEKESYQCNTHQDERIVELEDDNYSNDDSEQSWSFDDISLLALAELDSQLNEQERYIQELVFQADLEDGFFEEETVNTEIAKKARAISSCFEGKKDKAYLKKLHGLSASRLLEEM